MHIGQVCLHFGRPVFITGGQYMGTFGISNFWDFKYIREDGSLEDKEGHDYNNAPDKFVPIEGAKVTITVKLPEQEG